MKRFLSIAILLLLGAQFATAADKHIEAANALASRVFPKQCKNIEFIRTQAGQDCFCYYTQGGKLIIEGNNSNSMAMGFGDYLRNCCCVNPTWFSRDGFKEPSSLPKVKGKVSRSALVKDRFFLNYCTYGYTLNWWKWADWEHFIDWMALNGVNMVLANTGQEAVWQSVWTTLGLTREQTRAYFTGPAYLAWHRMTNIDGWDGPLPQSWIDAQAALQKQIIAREVELGISPILSSFNGHVPQAFKNLHPEADIRQLNSWGRFAKEYNCWYLSPRDPLYRQIQRLYLKIQKEMYGQDTHVYGVDPFNEVDPPLWEAGYLREAARLTYDALSETDPEAVWLQMSWLFYHKRKNWTPDLVQAYLEPVPHGRLLMLDYYCEKTELYRLTNCFHGQDFIWSYLGNFGGNTMIAGNISDISEKISRCYREGGKNFKGIGCTLEGLDVNNCMYEYVLNRAWTQLQDDQAWFTALADRRLGRRDNHYRQAWEIMHGKVMKEVATNRASRLISRPNLTMKANYATATLAYENIDLLNVWEKLTRTRPTDAPLFRFDCVNIPRQCLENYFNDQHRILCAAAKDRDFDKASEAVREMRSVLDDVEALTACDSYFLLGKWVADARSWGVTSAEQDYFEHDARMIVSRWTPHNDSLNDYANRSWNGLVGTYYKARWEKFFEEVLESLKSGREWNANRFKDWSCDFEKGWVDSKLTFSAEPASGTFDLCRALYAKYAAKIAATPTK